MRESRRSFLAKGSVIPAAAWLQSCNTTSTPPTKEPPTTTPPVMTRPNALSPAGQAMLAKYATVVGQMRMTENSPTAWLFQWYTHAVRPDRTKAAEIARVFPMPGPARDLAQAMWDTCEAHHATGVEDYFLPWHRMYVLSFEKIIRKLSGDPNFVLPYWNYSASGPSHGVIPPPFQQMASPLFQANRNAGVNTGQPIDMNAPGALDLTSLSQPTYSPSGSDPGFNMDLDGGLHGAVHVLTGNGTNMGSVPWAANDAIFWMHHCNIDRLWASWNKNGGKNPTEASWTGKQFTFADENGNSVMFNNGQMTDIAALNYTYEEFEPAPPGFTPAATVAPTLVTEGVASPNTILVRSVALGAAPARVVLQSNAEGVAVPSFRTRAAALAPTKKLHLVLRNLRAAQQPGILYGVYLNLPQGAAANREDFRVGFIHFFDASAHAGHGPGAPAPQFRSFDITQLVKKQGTSGALGQNATVTLVPMGAPAAGAQTVVGEVSIVEQ